MRNHRRREFIALLGGAAAAWPLAARAQQAAMPVIGYLDTGTAEQTVASVGAFRKGLGETGFVEGRNVTIEFRWANYERTRLPQLAADLVRRNVNVIATPGNLSAALAAKDATTSIPIVFMVAGDPVESGLVASLNHPGGNVTGTTSMNQELGAKRFGLLRELLPRATKFGLLVHPTNPNLAYLTQEAQNAAAALGLQMEILSVSSNREIDTAFGSLAQKRIEALSVISDTFLSSRQVQISTLAVRHSMPTMFNGRGGPDAGALMSYGASIADAARQAGIYTGRILKGEKPADLPVMRATRFEFVINLQTARTLGLEVPATLLAIADAVIE